MTLTEIVITGSWPTADGSTRAGEVLLSLSGDMRDSADGIVAPAGQQQGRLDEDGELAVQVYATDDATTEPAGRTYWVEERLAGATPRSYALAVPAAPAGSRAVADAATIIGVASLASATAAFMSGDVGKWITGPGLAPLTQILARVNGTTVTLSQPAAATLSGARAVIGASLDLSAA